MDSRFEIGETKYFDNANIRHLRHQLFARLRKGVRVRPQTFIDKKVSFDEIPPHIIKHFGYSVNDFYVDTKITKNTKITNTFKPSCVHNTNTFNSYTFCYSPIIYKPSFTDTVYTSSPVSFITSDCNHSDFQTIFNLLQKATDDINSCLDIIDYDTSFNFDFNFDIHSNISLASDSIDVCLNVLDWSDF